jgi:hypothetical protein
MNRGGGEGAQGYYFNVIEAVPQNFSFGTGSIVCGLRGF